MNLDISNANLIDNLNIDSYGYYNTRYSNFRAESLVSESINIQPVVTESVSAEPQPVLEATSTETATAIPRSSLLSSATTQPVANLDLTSQLVQPTTVNTVEQPASTPRYVQDSQTTQTAVQQNIVPVVPTPIPSSPTGVGFGGGAMGGGAMGGGGTSPKTTSTSASKESGMPTKQAPLTDKNIFKRFWFWGLLIGAGAGYYYAKTKNKKVLDFTLIASAIGGGVGLGIEMAVKNKMEKK